MIPFWLDPLIASEQVVADWSISIMSLLEVGPDASDWGAEKLVEWERAGLIGVKKVSEEFGVGEGMIIWGSAIPGKDK